jgi:hypothetical protein
LTTGSALYFSGTNLGINNTSPAVLATTTQVAIKANASADAMFVAQNSNGLTTAKFGFQFTGSVDNPVIGSYTDHPFLFLTNNTERARFTDSTGGSLLLGTTTLRTTGYTTGNSQYAMETTGYGGAQWFVNRVDDEGAYIVLGKSRGTTVNSNTVVANADTLGAVIWEGTTGSGVATAAQIRAKVDGSTISSSSMPGRLEFYTTASGSTSMTERLRIASNGAWGLGGANYGTSGQTLTSNGSGSAPTWQSAAVSSQWTTSGSNIYYNTGGVSIGTSTAPPAGNFFSYVASGQNINYIETGSSVNDAGFYFKNGVRTWQTFVNGTDGAYRIYDATSGAERIRISSGGVTGFRSSNPAASSQCITASGPGYGGGTGSGYTGSTVTQYYFDGMSADNGGSVNPVGFTLVGGGGGVPRGLIIGSYGNGRNTSSDSVFFTSNTGSSPFNNFGGPAAGVYRGALDATTYSPSSYTQYINNGAMTSFGVYDNWSSDYDGTTKCGIQVRLAGGYGGGSPGNWGGFCYTAYINTNFGSGSTGTNYGYYADITAAGSGNNWGIYLANGGAAKSGGGSWTATSDSRVKTVLGQYTRGLAEVLQLNVIDYEYNGKGGHAADGKRLTGVVAQEVQQVFPEMVSRRLDKLEETDTENTEILMVDNSALVYALVNCVKELKAELDLAKQRLAALEGA